MDDTEFFMKLFLDRHKTLLPRIDVIYLLTRVLTLIGILWFTFYGDYPDSERLFFYIVLGTFTAQMVIFFLGVRGSFDIKLAYLLAIVYDIIFVPVYVYYTGGIDSSFYLLLYLTISVAAYVLTFWFGTIVNVFLVLGYLLAIFPEIELTDVFDVSMRIGFVWVYSLGISYASDYLRRSERRLLKLFDTLNMRTSELEKSQAQLEMIYENTRILASNLKTEAIIKDIVRILGALLQHEFFALILNDQHGILYYRMRFEKGRANYHLRAIDSDDPKMNLIKKVFQTQEPIIIKDASRLNDYPGLGSNPVSAMLVPLTVHGESSGVLVAESGMVNAFNERHQQMLSIVARSAALSLENAELHKRTEELTIIDELTDTYNYRYFVQKLQEEKRRAIRYDLPLSIIMVDIDWFKKLNDSYGHEAGNTVISGLSQIIKDCIRDVDIFARYGGEEFAIILPQTARDEATRIGERIREEVEAKIFETTTSEKLKITVSVGVSSYPENGKSQEELVSIADQALYRAKGEGRNLVCVV